MPTLRIYLKAMRLPFLTGCLLPVIAAAALAYQAEGAWNLAFFLLTALGVAALQIGANLMNDYYDSFGSDPLNLNVTPFSAGSRVIQNRELSADTVRTMAYLFLALGVVCGLVLAMKGRPWVALLGGLGLAAGFFYSATPVQLMSRGVGEAVIFVAFGPLLSFGTYYVMTGKLQAVGACVGLPLAFLITAILWINEFPDLEADISAGKRNLVALLGLRLSRWGYAVLMLAPFATLFLLMERFGLPDLIVAALLPLPLALKAMGIAWRQPPTDPEFVPAQALTIQTHFLMGLTLTLALLYAAWWR